jgi:CRISPR/Cas system CSM-associated protein Csm3 (group 7 of RAMP superfamily)
VEDEMNARLTLFTATLVQDSALSVSGVDRESTADQPFSLVNGVPILSGRGLKGAAVAMARRFFEPLPRTVSEEVNRKSAYKRSAWEFANATPEDFRTLLPIRAGVGIRHKTGARAHGILYDREVVPAGTRWSLVLRVDWSHAAEEGQEAEGILGYVLARHWQTGRCWLGGGVARGLGWCHIEDLRAYRLDTDAYDRWVESARTTLPEALSEVPIVEPTRSWCFCTLDLKLSFGEYRPAAEGPVWGLDMLAVGPHDAERALQAIGDGAWARPSWTVASDSTLDAFSTDRAVLMDRGRPLLPGSSVRGPLRHSFSRAKTAAGRSVQDPHPVPGAVGPDDLGGQMFGTVARSSRILIRDSRAEEEWAAARLHMHAEDEFSAGSYESAKRDGVRVLRGVFPVRVVVEGPDPNSVEPLVAEIDRLIALGELGHLPVGGHKTRGAGWGRWRATSWINDDVNPSRSWTPPSELTVNAPPPGPAERNEDQARTRWRENAGETYVRVTSGTLDSRSPTLGEMIAQARRALGGHRLTAWWCDPSIDLRVVEPPAVFGRQWPDGDNIRVDEVAFYADRAAWRAARTIAGARWVLIEEVAPGEADARLANVIYTPARLYGSSRFAAAPTGQGRVLLREWHVDNEILGFTLVQEEG